MTRRYEQKTYLEPVGRGCLGNALLLIFVAFVVLMIVGAVAH